MQATISGTPVAIANNGTYTAAGGSNRVILFGVSYVDNDPGTTISGITFGGVAAHFIGGIEGDTSGINRPHVQWWYINEADSIPIGPQTVTVTYSSPPVSTRIHCFTVQNADQSGATIADVQESASAASLNGSFPSSSGSALLAAMTAEHNASNTNTTWTGLTEVTDVVAGAPSQRASAAYKNVTSGGTESISAQLGVPAAMVLVTASVQSAALFDDDFATGDKTHTENGVRWHGAGVRAVVVDDPGNSSGKALRLRFEPRFTTIDGDMAWAEQRFYLGPDGETGIFKDLWLKYRLLIPSNYQLINTPSTSSNDKWIRVWSRGSGFPNNDGYSPYYYKGGFSTRPLSTPGAGARFFAEWGTDLDGVGPNGTPNFTGWIEPADVGQEVEYIMRIKADTSGTVGGATLPTGGNGALQAWKNGVKIIDYTTLSWRSSTGDHEFFEYGYVLGYSNCGYDQQTDFLLRQFTIATSNIFGVS
jgi:hypothetical protein